MNEKKMFLQTWDNEFNTTLKVLKAYPPAKSEMKPHERLRSARELAWTFAVGEKLMENAIKGHIDFQEMPKPPATFQEVVSAFEKYHKETFGKVKELLDDNADKTVKFFTGPKQMGDVRRADVLWFAVMDQVHHRGQFSVYLRMAGGKVPSIYGPSADEPWM